MSEKDLPWWMDLIQLLVPAETDNADYKARLPGQASALVNGLIAGEEERSAAFDTLEEEGRVKSDLRDVFDYETSAPVTEQYTGAVRGVPNMWGMTPSPPSDILLGGSSSSGDNDMDTGNQQSDRRPNGGFGRFISEFEQNFLDKVAREYIAEKLPDREVDRSELGDKRVQTAYREYVAKGGRFVDPVTPRRTGGGSSRPKYVAPDRRTVEEWVNDKMIILTGAKQAEGPALVDAWMKAHKNAFEGKSIDPNAEVIERIRNSGEYQRIHGLRPDLADEDTWVSSRQNRLTQLGVGAKEAAARATGLAAAGTNLNDIDISKVQLSRGRKDITLFSKLEKAAAGIARRL